MENIQEKIWFEEVLFPQRSLSLFGFKILMAIILSLSILIGIFFYSLGAWPVTGFFGLDVLLIYVAFKIQYRHGKSAEIIRLSDEVLTISRIDHMGRQQNFSFNSYWVNITMSVPPNVPKNIGEKFIEARSHGKGIYFGEYITQEKRISLMKSLSNALIKRKTHKHSQ